MAEKIKVRVTASGRHPDVLTIQDAMQQVLDIFGMIENEPGVQWKLALATTNSPFYVEGEAVSFEPSVDVSVVARAQKKYLSENLAAISNGKPPVDKSFNIANAKRVLERNLNGVGKTEIDFELGEPVKVTPRIAKSAIEVISKKPAGLFEEIAKAHEEIGSVEGTLQDVGTYKNKPAVRIKNKMSGDVWCVLSEKLQTEFQDRATYKDVWRHQRVVVRGKLNYRSDGVLNFVFANDINLMVPPPEVNLDKLRDTEFTGGLSIADYLEQFREGNIG